MYSRKNISLHTNIVETFSYQQMNFEMNFRIFELKQKECKTTLESLSSNLNSWFHAFCIPPGEVKLSAK